MVLSLLSTGFAAVHTAADVGGGTVSSANTSEEVEKSWPNPRGAGQNAYFPENSGPTTDPAVQWTYEVGVAGVGVAVADGTVYLTDSDGAVHAIDLASGSKKWVKSVNADTTPAVSDGRVVVGSGEKIVEIYAEKDPHTESTNLNAEVNLPVAYENKLYVTAGRYAVVLADDGDDQWAYEAASEIIGPPAVTNESVFIATRSAVVALNRDTGEKRWAYADHKPNAGPAVYDEYVVYGGESRVVVLDRNDGTNIAEAFDGSSEITSILVSDRRNAVTVFVVYEEEGLFKYQLIPSNHELLNEWIMERVGNRTIIGGKIIYMNFRNQLQAIDYKLPEQKWKKDSEAEPLAAVNGTLIVANDGKVRALSGSGGDNGAIGSNGDRSDKTRTDGSRDGSDVASTPDGPDGASSPTDAPLSWRGPTLVALVVVVLVGIARGVVDSE